MRLKHVKLAGFKSFVDPTTVSFPGNRCAVVGPNGCGKSNIIDAVRWVMGESSAKQLRGESLTDVIFNGSNTRKPITMASIELIFDNSDGRIGGEYSGFGEIAIRRTVSRDSQSHYFLNGSKCRRRDIMDIFLGTGFGPRSYSIIEQGMISQLVEAKPEDLRVYLEEAAGISKYKERRRETENRIKHTVENLNRLNDIREELEKQLNHLKRQARAAERYRELKQEERKFTAQLHSLRLLELEQLLSEQAAAIRRLEVELEQALAAQSSLGAELETVRAEHGSHSDAFNQVQGRFYQLGADIARIEEAIQYNQKRVQQLELDLGALSQRRQETQRQLNMDDEQIERLRSQLADISPKVDAAQAEDRTASESLEAVEQEMRQWQEAWDNLNQSASASVREADVQASRIEHVEQVLQRLRSRLMHLDDEYAGVMEPSDNGEMGTMAAQIEEFATATQQTDRDIEACIQNLASAREDLVMREQILEEARTELQNLRHELASLEALQQAALGRQSDHVDTWIQQQGLSEAPRVGEDLAVVPGWESAVEMVLGDRLQALQVDSLDALSEGLDQLDRGSVMLLEPRDDLETQGDLPGLSTFVRARNPLGSLLYQVFAAESLTVALEYRNRLEPGQSIVTRAGVWLGNDWIRIERGDAEESGIIQRSQEIDALVGQVEAAQVHLSELQQHVVDGRSRVEELEQKRETLQRQATELNNTLAQLRADHGVHQVRLEEAGARKRRVEQERQEIETQIAQETGQLEEARARLVVAEQQREAAEANRERFAAQRESGQQGLELARRKAREKHDVFHTLNSERQAIESQLASTRTARERLLEQQQQLDERQQEINSGIEDSHQPLPDLQRDLAQKLKNRAVVEQELTQVRRALENADDRIRELEALRGERDASVDAVRQGLEHARVERQGLVVRQSGLLEQLTATGLEFAQVKAELPADATESAWVEALEKLTNRITRLGPINLAAIDEFQSQSERKEYLDAQFADLEEALETLRGAIRKIDKETRSRFKATYEEVNRRLGILFPKVFGGGSAYLEMTGEDLLDTGISLMARPPGKRNASVHLLSGGEKALTAVALIFAIFQLNPSPVCILDEVDAPLDDHNVLRFTELIREMSEDVQFVVITHNKITMEMADYLMGVTMSEAGVSRLVSVDVEEAAGMAAV